MATVWIDRDGCMGAGTCSQIAPEVFKARGDGTWSVMESAAFFGQTTLFDGSPGHGHGPEGHQGQARVPDAILDQVIDAAEECPGECIFVEV